MSEKKTIEIDGKKYSIDDLSEEARAQLVSLRVVDQEIIRLQHQMAIAQTARLAYGRALNQHLNLDVNTPPPSNDDELSFTFDS